MAEETEQTEHKKPLSQVRSRSGRVVWIQTPRVSVYCEDHDSDVKSLAVLGINIIRNLNKEE